MDDSQQGHVVDASLAFLQKLEDEMRVLTGNQLGSSGSSNNSSATLDSLSAARKRKRLESSSENEASKKIRTTSAGQDTVVFGPAEPPRHDRSLQLPAELWHHILSFLSPDTLGRLLRVNRLFHKYLDPVSPFIISTPVIHVPTPRILPTLSPDAIWRASRCLHWPTMPAPLKGKFELDMWRFACTRSCQLCGRLDKAYTTEDSLRRDHGNTTVSPIFPFFINSCGNCLAEKSVKEVDIYLSHYSFISRGLPMVFLTPDVDVIISPHALQSTPSIPTQLTKVYWPAQVERLQEELEEAKRFGTAASEEWIKGLDSRGTEAVHDASRWDKWLLSGGVRQMRIHSTQPTANKVERMQIKGSEIAKALRKHQQDVETVVRTHICNLADEVIRDRWDKGRSVKKENCAEFVTDVLTYIRKQFYQDAAKSTASLTRRLTLDDMRWIFDQKIGSHTDHHQKEFLLCRECPKRKRYGFQAIMQHYAMKHCSKKMKSMAMQWKAEWPEQPPFRLPSVEKKITVDSIHQSQHTEGVDPSNSRVDAMAKILRPAWNALSKAKNIPTSVKTVVLIHRIAKWYQEQYREPAPLEIFMDGLDHHESFSAVSKCQGLACKVCMSSLKQDQNRGDTFSLPALAHHFHNVHGKGRISPTDWIVDMIWLPDLQIQEFLAAIRTNKTAFSLISDALPWLFNSEEERNQNGPVPPGTQQSPITTDSKAADTAPTPVMHRHSDEQPRNRADNFRTQVIDERFENYEAPDGMRAQYIVREPVEWSGSIWGLAHLSSSVSPRHGVPEPRRHLETYYLRREHAPHMIEAPYPVMESERERSHAEAETRHTSRQSYVSGYRQPVSSTTLYRTYDIVDIRGLPIDQYIEHPTVLHDYRIPSNTTYSNYTNRESHNNTAPESRVYNTNDSRDSLANRRSGELE